MKEAAKSLNINYSTAKTILRVFRIENRILKKSPYQKRSRRTPKNKIFNFQNGNNSHNSDSNNHSQRSPSQLDSDPNTFNNINHPGFESSKNLNLQLSQLNSNNFFKENFLNFPTIFNATKEKNNKDKSMILDATMNLTSIPTQNNTPSGNICNSPILNMGTFKNSSIINSYPASSNPSNNNLTSITDFNLNKGSLTNNNINNYHSGNPLGINISNNSNFVCASNYAFGNTNNNSDGSADINRINSNSNCNQNTSYTGINAVLNNFFGNGNLNSTAAYANYLNSYPDISKSTEEFMENFYSLVNMLKSCISEIINNEYTIRSLTNIIKNMGNNAYINSHSENIENKNYANFDNEEITQVNFSNPEVFINNKQNK